MESDAKEDFVSFAGRAKALLGADVDQSRTDFESESQATAMSRFARFIDQARALSCAKIQQAPDSFPSGFQAFCTESREMLVAPLRRNFRKLRQLADTAQQWWVSHDLLDVAGLSFSEDPYTELLRWALSPDTHPESARARQAAWLSHLGIKNAVSNLASPISQVLTRDGIPDLLLDYNDFAVVVEAKTGTSEHTTPLSGNYQTIAYPPAVQHYLGRDEHIYMVYLTIDRERSQNTRAIQTTWASVAVSIMTALSHEQLPPDARYAFGMFFTHLLTHAVPPGTDIRGFCSSILAAGNTGLDEDELIASNLGTILRLKTLLRGEEDEYKD